MNFITFFIAFFLLKMVINKCLKYKYYNFKLICKN